MATTFLLSHFFCLALNNSTFLIETNMYLQLSQLLPCRPVGSCVTFCPDCYLYVCVCVYLIPTYIVQVTISKPSTRSQIRI